MIMTVWRYEIENRENVIAFLKEMDKELGRPVEVEATFDILEYLAVLEKSYGFKQVQQWTKKRLLKTKKDEITIDFYTHTITGEKLIDVTEITKTSCFGLNFETRNFERRDRYILALIYNDSITVEGNTSKVPEIVKKYGKNKFPL